MATYQIETDGGTYQIETDDPTPQAPQQPAAVQQAMQYANSGGQGAPPPIPTQGKVPYALAKQEFDNSPLQASPIMPSGMAAATAGASALHWLGGKLGMNLTDKAAAKGQKVLGGPILPRPSGLSVEGTPVPTVGQGLLKQAESAIPSRTRAGLLFDEVSGAAGKSPVDTSGAGDTALKMQEMADSGASMPKVAKDYLKRVTDPNKGPLTFDEARQFASNAGRQSVNEYTRMTPAMKAKMSEFASKLSAANKDVAEKAGVGPQYQKAMGQYKAAARVDSLKNNAVDAVKGYGVKATVGGLLGYELSKKLGLL